MANPSKRKTAASDRELLAGVAIALGLPVSEATYAGLQEKIFALIKERDDALAEARSRHTLLDAIATGFATIHPTGNYPPFGTREEPADHAKLPGLVADLREDRDHLREITSEINDDRGRLRVALEEARLLLDTPAHRAQCAVVDRLRQASEPLVIYRSAAVKRSPT